MKINWADCVLKSYFCLELLGSKMRFKHSYFNLSNLFQKEFKSHTYEEHHLHVRLTLEISLLHNFLTPFYSLLPLSYVEHVTHTQQPLSKPSCAYVIILLKMIIFRTSLWAETIFIRTRALEVHLIIHFMYLDMTLPECRIFYMKNIRPLPKMTSMIS
jgi:hypothetical protein